ncbi:MAG TPA: cell envelope integrity EipB family protein [Stellaceae bacterium]|nr:cell envelope integrity EipB family protein [Stellaceae bacterium]
MNERWLGACGAAVLASVWVWSGAASAVEATSAPNGVQIAAHRALYAMNLAHAKTDSGVTGAHGEMGYQWGETCDGWTVEQRYRLTINYSESQDVNIDSNFVTWESKDGLQYRFNQKETRNGSVDEEIRGSAQLDGPGKGGTITFEKPHPQTMKLPPGALFPSAHTILLIEKAKAGEDFVARQVFDGATVEGAVLVSAVIGKKVDSSADQKANSDAKDAAEVKHATDPKGDQAAKNGDAPDPSLNDPVLQRPGWRIRLAFFPSDPNSETPDYELGMLLLDNGISRDMTIDYGDYTINAKLIRIEPLGKPHC